MGFFSRKLKNARKVFKRYPKSNAFTLAEVLITLGVIGVVACMTMMVMIHDHQQKVRATQLEKAKTVIANGYRLMAARQGVTEFADLAFWDCPDFACFQREHKDIFQVVYDASHLNFSLALMPQYNNAAWADTLVESAYLDRLSGYEFEIAWKECEYAFMTPDAFVMGLTGLDYDTRKELYIADAAATYKETFKATEIEKEFGLSSKM